MTVAVVPEAQAPEERALHSSGSGAGSYSRKVTQRTLRVIFHTVAAQTPSSEISLFRRQKICKSRHDFDFSFCFAFPHNQGIPPELVKISHFPMVTGDILPELVLPEGGSGFWRSCPIASVMSMPEAAVNENHLSASGETDVGRSGGDRSYANDNGSQSRATIFERRVLV